jgi:hypothetical protein
MAKKSNKKLSDILISRVKELASGIVAEEMSAVYLDLSTIKHQPEPIYRLDNNNYRYYYRMLEGEPEFYTSVTTMIHNNEPTPSQLLDYLRTHDDEESGERMAYGTLMHTICQSFLIKGSYDLDNLAKELNEYCIKEKIPQHPEWEKELKKDILAFAQFVIDKKIKPLAIEIILYHPTDGYAGALDLVCSLDIEEKGFFGETYASGANKGQPKESKQTKRINAIVDLKSGRKGAYESYEIQLGAYYEMWKIHFPEISINKLYNWYPKEWRSVPSYNLKDQTEAFGLELLENCVARNKKTEKKKDKAVTVISGVIEPAKGLEKNICETNIINLIKKSYENKQD